MMLAASSVKMGKFFTELYTQILKEFQPFGKQPINIYIASDTGFLPDDRELHFMDPVPAVSDNSFL